MKCIVTGGAGFIGSHLCEYLVKKGNTVISIDNYKTGKKENHRHLDGKPNFEAVKLSVLDNRLRDYMQGVDVIFHQAASKKTVCLSNPCLDLDTNAKGTLKLLQLAKEFNVIKFVHASTGSVYGSVNNVIDERTQKNPVSFYGISKLAGENYVNYFNKTYGLNTTILRYFHVYGSRQDSSNDGGVVSIFSDRMKRGKEITIYGSGEQIRCFTHVKDVVNANLLSLGAKPDIYNVCSGIRVTIHELIEKLEEQFGISEYKERIYKDWMEGDIKDFDIDNRKIKTELGMTFETKLNFDWL